MFLIFSIVFSIFYMICEHFYDEYKKVKMQREKQYLRELQIILDNYGYKIKTRDFITVDDVLKAIDSMPDTLTKREIKKSIFYSPLNSRLKKLRDEIIV